MKQINKASAEELIIGTWQWNESLITDRGVRPPNDRKTPQSEGYTEQRKFLPNGQVEFYKDGSLTGTYTYRIEPKGGPASKSRVYHIYIGENYSSLKISADTLIIGLGGRFGTCGIDSIYTKVEEFIG
jgi:hypothetical protein